MEFFGLLSGTALVLGAVLMLVGVALAMLTFVGIALALLFFRTRQIVIPSATLFILTLLEAPIRYVLWVFGVEEDIVSRMVIEVRNILYRDSFDRTPYDQRAMFIPQCLRSPSCPAPLTPEGIKCLNCGKCGIGGIKEEAESLGYRVFIAPGSSLVKRMVKKYRPKAVLGVGCPMEVKEGTAKMASYGLPVQGVLLERDGCVDTRIEVTRLLEKVKSSHLGRRHYKIEEDPESMAKALRISALWGDNKPSQVEVVSARKSVERVKW